MKTGAQRATKTSERKKPTPTAQTQPVVSSYALTPVAGRVLQLHRTIGNQAVQRIIQSGVLQARLEIGKSADVAEQVGDRAAAQLNRTGARAVSRQLLAIKAGSEKPCCGQVFRRLPALAHEPVRVTHQAKGSVHRLADEDLIKDKFTGQMEYPDRVFFDFDADHVDEFQQRRIGMYFADKADINLPITLTGLASEEGNRSYNLDLAARRANEVKMYILQLNPKASINLMPPRVESGTIDYRFVRAVVINEKVDRGGGRRDDQSVKCNIENLRKLQDKSLELVSRAQANVDSVDFESTIRSLFGDPVPKDAIKGNLGRLRTKLGEILKDGAYECATPDDPICSSGALAYANRITNKISYCPESPAAPQKDEKEKVNTMIHETLHLTPGLFTKDYAYASDPLISHLRQGEALHNTDSYVILIRKLANSIAPPQAGFEGTTTGFNNSERDQIRESIGWAMSSVKAAQYQIAILYQAVHLTLANGKWPESHIGYIDLYKRLTPVFGLTPLRGEDHGKRLADEDKWKLASIHDKLKSLTGSVNPDIKKYDINRDDGVAFIDFDFRPMYAIAKIQGSFPALSLDERIKKILLEIINEGKLTPNYVSAIVEIRDFMGNKWPT